MCDITSCLLGKRMGVDPNLYLALASALWDGVWVESGDFAPPSLKKKKKKKGKKKKEKGKVLAFIMLLEKPPYPILLSDFTCKSTVINKKP